jgi:multidrug resistance efflux pump
MNVSSANVVASVLSEGRIERQKAADERASGRLRDAQSAVAALKKMNASASDQKKAAAKQRVDQLKARLEMLKMSSPPMGRRNP